MIAFSPQIIIAGVLAVVLIAFSKAAFGGGFAVVGIPILALVMDPVDAAIVLAPLLPLTDMATLKVYPPSTWSKPDLLWLAVGLLSGMALGALLFAGLPRNLTSGLIGAVILIFALRQLILRRPPGTPLDVSPGHGLFWGALSGVGTFIANAGQPPVAIYLMRRNLPKTAYAGTMSAVFMLANLAKLPMLGTVAMDRLYLFGYSLALIPAIPLGTYIGKVLHDRLDRDRLFQFVYILLALAGAKLLGSSLGIIP